MRDMRSLLLLLPLSAAAPLRCCPALLRPRSAAYAAHHSPSTSSPSSPHTQSAQATTSAHALAHGAQSSTSAGAAAHQEVAKQRVHLVGARGEQHLETPPREG